MGYVTEMFHPLPNDHWDGAATNIAGLAFVKSALNEFELEPPGKPRPKAVPVADASTQNDMDQGTVRTPEGTEYVNTLVVSSVDSVLEGFRKQTADPNAPVDENVTEVP